MATLGRRQRAPWQRAVGWRPAPLADNYDVVVIGDGPLGVATAWALTEADEGLRVAVVVPTHLGSSWDPAAVGRLHALRTPAALAAAMPASASRLRTWTDRLGMEPPRVRGGHLVVATTTSSWVTLRDTAARVPSCRPLDAADRAQLMAGLAGDRCLAAWHEPLATSVDLGVLLFRLAEAACGGGVDLVDDAAVVSVTAGPGGYEVLTTAGRTVARTVIDADPALAVSRAAGLGGTTVTGAFERLTTAAMAPLLELDVTVDDVDVAQRASGAVELLVPVAGPPERDGLAASAAATRAVLEVLPELSSAPVVDRSRVVEALTVDGLPVVGLLAPGLWSCGGLGRHRLDLLPLLAEGLSEAVREGTMPAALAGFDPARLRGVRSPVLSSASRWNCPICGGRDRAEFTVVAGRVVHVGGCGRPVGGTAPPDAVIDLREPQPRRVAPPAPAQAAAFDDEVAPVGRS